MKVVLPLLLVCGLSLACTGKSATAPTATAMPTTLENTLAKPLSGSEPITILSGAVTVEGVNMQEINIDLRGTSGIRMTAYDEQGDPVPVS